MEDLFLILAVIFAIAMIVLMIKYANFIHSQPKMEAERKKMQDHAAVTLKMLKQIPFTKKLKNIPDFAGAHHEFINGKGYPLGLKGDEIPFEGKLMAVTDIAEALTASDRPYKKAMPLETVYRILRSMAEKEELDTALVELFIEKEVYKIYQQKYENGNTKDN